MKMKKTLIMAASAVLLTAGVAKAEHQWDWSMKDRFHYASDSKDLYAAQEFTLDLFGAYQKDKDKFNDSLDRTLRHEGNNGDFGGGLGFNYFFTRNIGIGGDTIILDNRGSFLDSLSLSAVFRFPLGGSHFAPYAFAGGGYQFGPNSTREVEFTEDDGDRKKIDVPDAFNLHAGVGMEFRLNSHTGIFIDGRHAWHLKKDARDYVLLRSGLRFAF